MKTFIAWFGSMLLVWSVAQGAEIRVAAAASLADALNEIGAAYEKVSGDRVVFNFGASNVLARQIEQGARADIFFSADEAKMDALEQRGLVVKDTRKARLSNLLAVVVASDSPMRIDDPAKLAEPAAKKIALADPAGVPAGIYARAYLEKAGLWTAVKPKVVMTENVRGALAAVASGNVDAGIVYQSDVRLSAKVRAEFVIPRETGPSITYPVALLRDAKQVDGARKFLDYLGSDEATGKFEKFGFIVLK